MCAGACAAWCWAAGKALGDELRAGDLRGFLDDFADALTADATAVDVRHEVVVRAGRQACGS
jgi:hypothetical protein